MSERLQAQGQDLELFRDKCLGSGAYGVVCKAKLNELPCAAKLLHRVLFHPTIQRRFDQEHVLLQSMKHPNVVQYLGVAHDPQSGQPILLMELLDGNLTDFLEHSDGPIPYHLQVNLRYDVALALTYLHSKHIIHRDLSGNNVLLIAGSRAKVSDFGMSMFTHVDVTKSRLTHCPGNANYMSPEAMMENPIYTEKLDVFSSGVVAVQIITQQFPEPTSSMTRCNDPKSPTGYSFTPVSEIERRKNHIVLIDPKHPMLPMIQSCLRDKDCERPPAQQLCHQLVSLKQAPEYAHSKRQPTPNERRIQEQQQLIQNQQREIENQRRNMQQAVQQMQTKVTKQEQVIQKQQREIEDQRREKEQAVQQMQTEITKWKGSVQVLNTQLHEKSQELQLKKQELWKTQYNLQQKTEQLQQKTEELQEQSKDLQQALQGQEFQRGKMNLIEQLPQAFVTRFTAEELPHHIKKLIEEGLQEWEGNLCKFHLFCGHPSSGDLMERKLEVHKSLTLGEVTERAYQVLELEQCGVQLEQCQLVRYNVKNEALGKPFDEPKEMPFGEVVDEPQSFSSFDLLLEIQTDPAALPQYEQEMRAIRVICINYSLIWQYLVAGNVLPKLMEKSVISVSKKQEVELYQQRYGQNAVIIDSVLDGGHAPEGLLTICDTLQTNLGKEHIAQHILREYKRQPTLRALCSPGTGSTDVLSDASLQFQHLKQDLVDSLVQCPNALTQLKQCLASLVLPLGDGKVASLVDPSSYEAASTIPELFRLMAPYWNCLSTNLLSLLLEASSCKPAAAKLAEFEEARTSSGTLVLCTQTASTGELKSVHSLPLEQLHSLHPAVFTESVASEQAEQNTARITAAVSKPLLQVSCYEKTATAICGFFRLPKAALVYAGCSENPLALCWLVSRNLLSYMRNHTGSLSGYHLLAEQQITHIAFGEVEFHNCPNLKEVELCESSRYGLLERIPDLLAIVSVDVAYADGITPLWTASAHGQKKVVELLLAAGANPNQPRKDGWAPLHAASQEGHDQVVDLLLEAGASVEQETEDGQTALYIASGNGHGEIVKLLKREADMDHETKFGDTPLGIARSQGLEHITQLLCDANKLSLTLVPTHECKKLPEAIPLGLTPWQEPEKREEAELEAELEAAAKDTMHSGFLNFNSKSGATSVSSDKEAHHSAPRRQDPTNSLVSRDGQAFEFQFSPLSHDESVCTDEIMEQSNEIPVPKSPSISGLIPCAPTGSEWSPSKPSSHTTRQRGSDSDIVEFQDLLRDLDKKAVEQRPHFLQARSLKSLLTTSVSWEEGAVSSQHIWHDSDTREACHVAETQFCQEQKLVHPKRTKVRCSACKMLAHVTCLHQLNYEGFTCKETFREIKHKGSGETVVLHHFLHRRKASGRCKKCERGFGNWKKLTGREIVGISCSWCGDSYHLSCYSDQFKREPCHLGPLRNSIIPPSWIVKVPPLEQTSQGSQSDDSPKRSHRKTRLGRRRKQPTDTRASKHFTVKPFSQRQNKPLLVFINPKSDSNQGDKLMQIFQWLLNPRQVFDLTKGGPKFGLKMYRHISNFRILVCGGDGTAGWVLSVLDELEIRPSPPVAVLPLGSENDLARILGWGGGYTDEPLDKILMHVEEGPVVEIDRWRLSVWKNPHAHELEGQEDVPLHVINNSFSVGCDAQVALEFHLEREANPEKYKNKSSRKIGGKEVVLRRFADLTDHLQLYCDGGDLTGRIRQLRLEALCFLNIPSYGGGTNPWGTPPTRDQRIGPQKVDDGKIEIVGFWVSTFLKLRMGMAHGERIAQCEHIKLITNKSLPVQIDGEVCMLQPSVIEVVQKNKALMVRKVARRHSEAPLHGVRPSDRIKLSVSKVTCDQYERMNSDLEEIRRAAFSFGVVVATLQDTLKSLRPQIDTYTNEQQPGRKLAQNWRYLDVATGRMNRMFQVLPDQEENIYIGDMLADDIIVVELESSPVSTPESKPKILLSPVDGGEDTCIHSLAALESHAERRKYLGRNKTYRMATGGPWEMSPPPEPSSDRLSPVEDVQQQEEVQSQDPFSPSFQSASSMESPSHKTPISLSEEEKGDVEVMKSPLLEIADTSDSTDLDVQEPSNIQKILLDAVKRGNVVKVMESHDKGAKLTAADSYGWTPLHHAARLGKKDVVQYLVENIPRENLDIPDDEMLQTALHKAALYGYRSICKTLVDSGASLMRKDHQGYTPYHKSIQSGDAELQQYLKRKEREQKTKTKDEEMPV